MFSKKHLKILGVLAIFLPIFSFAFSDQELRKAGCEPKTFSVTSYYSPLQNQSFYYRGNYADEVYLNGKGTHGASGAPVFDGMLAAPKTYNFGDYVYFPSMGRGKIEDRGGAIVNAGERNQSHDRIDIRAGKGEVGLIRGLTFGRKDLAARYCPKIAANKLWKQLKNKIGFDRSNTPLYKNFFLMTTFIQEMSEGRRWPRVYELQNQLIKLWYLNKGLNTGFFGPKTKTAVCDFQVAKHILSKQNERCGYYGAQTRYSLKQNLKAKNLLPTDFRAIGTYKGIHDYAQLRKNGGNGFVAIEPTRPNYNENESQNGNINDASLPTKKTPQIEFMEPTEFTFNRAFALNQKHENIGKLQTRLQLLGYYTNEINNTYTNETKKSVLAFQQSHGLLTKKNKAETSPGYLGKPTRTMLNKIKRNIVYKEKKSDAITLTPLEYKPVRTSSSDIYFSRSFKKGERHTNIAALQKLLQTKNLYHGPITSTYDTATIYAIYEFQKTKNIVSESTPEHIKGFFGLVTRAAVNELLQG